MKRSWFLIVLCLPLLLCGCAQKSAEREFFAMDTVMQLRAYGPAAEDALAQAEAEIYRLEGVLSCRDEQAALARLNETGGGTAGEETAALLQTALTLCEQTGGAYDPALGALSEAWGFSTGAYRVPEPDALAEAMQSSGAGLVQLDGISVTLTNGAQLDLGGIAKGYAGDAVRTVLAELNITSAVIDLGGDVGLLGAKPDGSDWRVAVKDPADPSKFLGVLTAADTFVVTSGIYERGFEENGVRYHHIIDPKTGKPAESGLVSVTVVCG
ncbi:MAG: FAD:protein FMN transferase, partial [Oscillospiraceae bacterium]|nr:FAD:protein FMN transferase [Oscillospiraceae bacterium]